MLEVYEGDNPYVFVCYAHADDDAVLPLIAALVAEGYRVWWDKGIDVGTRFSDNVARHILGCACFLMLVSSCSIDSKWWKNEVDYALEHNKPVLPVYLEEVELPGGLQLRLGSLQAMYWHSYAADEEFNERLFSTKTLDPCLTREAKRRRGVSARAGRVSDSVSRGNDAKVDRAVIEQVVGEDGPTTSDKGINLSGDRPPINSFALEFLSDLSVVLLAAPIIVALALVIVIIVSGLPKSSDSVGVVKVPDAVGKQEDYDQKTNGADGDEHEKASVNDDDLQSDSFVYGVQAQSEIEDYSWDGIKVLSRAIASASDGEWLEIAKVYNLVDQDGKLQGATKSIMLTDGTYSRVRIIGFRHDTLRGGGLAGISFEFDDVPSEREMNAERTNVGGWESSEMRERLNAGFINLLPDDLRPHVEEVEKLTNNVGMLGPEGDVSVVTPTFDKIWLLSMCEIYGRPSEQFEDIPKRPEVYDAEGGQYQLYADHGVMAASHGFCGKKGEDSFWWLRSPSAENSDDFLYVGHDGAWHSASADFDWGVSPCFCL